MAVTQSDIEALEAAIRTGATEVQRGEERVRYRSLDEMETVLKSMKAELAGSSRVSKIRLMTPRTSRGF